MAASEKNDVKETIITVAQSVFSRFGFRKTTMDEIAEASRKAKSSVYHYFKSKEDIFKIIVERESVEVREVIRKAVNQANTPQEKIHTYVLVRMREVHRLLNYYTAMKDEYLDHYPFIERMRREHDKEEVQRIKEMLQEGVDKGVFEIKDIDALAYVFVVALKGLEHEWVRIKDFAEIEKTINSLTSHLLYGIIKR